MPTDFSDDATPRLNLPYLAAAQAQKHVTLNEAMAMLDGLVQSAVTSDTVAVQPSDPDEGALYILPADRTGSDWSLFPPGALVRLEAGAWTALPAPVGALHYLHSRHVFRVRSADGWRDLGGSLGALQGLERLGLGTEADATNPFAAKLNKLLFTARAAAEGGDGDLRFTLNKETAADVLSLLFQSGFAGRAEIGLVGGDDFAVRVSPDGSAWLDALTVARATGHLGVGVAEPLGVLHTRSATGRTIVQSDSPGMRSSLLLLNGDSGPAAGSGLLFGAGGDGQSTGFIGGMTVQRTDADQNSVTGLRVPSGGALTTAVVLQGGPGGAKLGVGVSAPKSRLDVDGAVRVKGYPAAGLPSAEGQGAGAIVFVTDEAGGPTLAFSDGAAWRRVADRAVVA